MLLFHLFKILFITKIYKMVTIGEKIKNNGDRNSSFNGGMFSLKEKFLFEKKVSISL
jgi:hypothetical protein